MSIQMGPQIRLIQSNDTMMAEKIQKAKRANAEQELGRIEGELRQKMLEINN